MADLLKNLYTEQWINQLGNAIAASYSSFNTNDFQSTVIHKDWADIPLKMRTRHITECIHEKLALTYPEQIEVLLDIAPQFQGLTALVFPTFVELYGLNHYRISLDALLIFTQYSTAEFAIRPFIVKYSETIKEMVKWTSHENKHIRRLASEGCRPLLPWAMKLKEFEKDPSPILPILENIRNDPEDYVYRSVANNLNDISKNHPDLVLKLCKKWINESRTTRWVCKHALRTLLKKGNQEAMELFGFGAIKSIEVTDFTVDRDSYDIGDHGYFSFNILNHGIAGKFRVEYAIGYVKKSGSVNKKVFQIKETRLESGEVHAVKKKIDFKDLSTRKHYPGLHYLGIIINGYEVKRLSFGLKQPAFDA